MLVFVSAPRLGPGEFNGLGWAGLGLGLGWPGAGAWAGLAWGWLGWPGLGLGPFDHSRVQVSQP